MMLWVGHDLKHGQGKLYMPLFYGGGGGGGGGGYGGEGGGIKN